MKNQQNVPEPQPASLLVEKPLKPTLSLGISNGQSLTVASTWSCSSSQTPPETLSREDHPENGGCTPITAEIWGAQPLPQSGRLSRDKLERKEALSK
jgi:hypothetical protein